MAAHQMLMKMFGREAGLPAAIKASTCASRSAATRFAGVVKTLAPAPERPLPGTQKLRCFRLVELRRLATAQYLHKLDYWHTVKGFRPAHWATPTPFCVDLHLERRR
jgi:hypothetical protein